MLADLCSLDRDPHDTRSSATEDPHATLSALNARVDELVAAAGAASWTPRPRRRVTWPCRSPPGLTDEVSLTAMTPHLRRRHRHERPHRVRRCRCRRAATGRDEVLARWRLARGELADSLKSADREKIQVRAAHASRVEDHRVIMETWAHGVDADALGISVSDDLAFVGALPHVAKLGFKTRAFAYMMNGSRP